MQKAHKDEIKRFGENVKKLRINVGLTQVDLAALCDIDRITIIRIEKGLLGPSFHIITSLAKAFKIKTSELFDYQ